MYYQINLLFHCRAVQSCLPHFRAQATLNFRNFSLEVRARNRYHHFMPQFIYREGGKLHYTPQMRSNVLGCIGWLPYFNKRWPAGTEKFAFKEYCLAEGLRTPRYSTQTAGALGSFVIKHRYSSFGNGLRGPFRNADRDEPSCRLAASEYYEEFVPGKIAKAWYWDEKLVCLEIYEMPTVTGDGAQSLSRLIGDRVFPPNKPPERSELEALARYHGVSLDEPIPAGTTVLADFRYGSPLIQVPLTHNGNVLASHAETEVGLQFAVSGPAFWRSIPEDIRPSTLYSVDAIVDDEKRVWFLEMNCNPTIHPDTYFAMFEGLFGKAEKLTARSRPEAAGTTFPLEFPILGLPPNGGVPLAHPLPAPAPASHEAKSA